MGSHRNMGLALAVVASLAAAGGQPDGGRTGEVGPQPVTEPTAEVGRTDALAPPIGARLHLRLLRSEPAADTTVAAVEEIRLWFSQAPQEDATSIRLADAEGELVPSTEVQRSGEEGTVFFTRPKSPLPPGSYRIFWRTMAADGHVVRGNFGFRMGS